MMVGVQTPLSGRQRSAFVPDSHRDLLDCPPVAALTTLMPDGSPHTTPVWCEFDGVHVPVNTMRGFLKERNMRRNPRVTLLCYDPAQTLRSLEARVRVIEMTRRGRPSTWTGLASATPAASAILIGAFAGLMPAIQASRMPPIVALRTV
jgi:predicted pyridoxine 5'-phosphate oxidase superfamily flavin-nucleotide-binding protein